MQLKRSTTHSPSGHIVVPEGQFDSNSLQSSLFATQLLYLEHFIGLSTGHPLDSATSLSESHSSKSFTQRPLLGHLYGVIKGHPFAAGHLLLLLHHRKLKVCIHHMKVLQYHLRK